MKSDNSSQLYSIPSILRSTPIAVLTVAALFILLSKISLLITIDPGRVSPIFFSAGLAFASMLILGRKALIGVWIGSFYSNTFLNTTIESLNQTHFLTRLPIAFFISTGIIIATLSANLIINQLSNKEYPLSSGKNVLTLLVLGPIVYSTITSLVGVISVTLHSSITVEQFWYIYKTWWIGDSIGIILITPLILSWSSNRSFNKKNIKTAELALYTIMTILLCFAVFFHYHYLKYLILPWLFWSAYRFGFQTTTLLILIISLFSIITTSQGIGPFNEESLNDSILLLNFFLSVVTICSLFFAGVISERERAEEALKKSETKYRNIFENIQDVIFQTDPKGIFLNISPSIQAVTGYTPEELIGKPTNVLQTDEEEPDVLIRLINEQFLLKNFEKLIKTKSGKIIWINLNAKMILDKNGTPNHIDAIAEDITQRKANEKKIAEQNKKLKIQNKELEQIVYITSHDLQEPLITLKSFSELLKTDIPKDPNQNINQYVDFILESSGRMQQLIKGLMDYSRIGNQISAKNIESKEIVNKAILTLADPIEKTMTQITVGDLPRVNGDFQELTQLFEHLISNAIKFRKKDIPLRIDISAKKVMNNWQFTIADNGIGIEEQNREKLFVIFKRLNNREDYAGIGIGLAICKKIITLHGGSIWLESLFGEGTTIHFTLPIQSEKL